MRWPNLDENEYMARPDNTVGIESANNPNSSKRVDVQQIKAKWLKIEERFHSAKQTDLTSMTTEEISDASYPNLPKIDAFDLREYILSMSELQRECESNESLLAQMGVLQARCEDLLVSGYFSLIEFNCRCSLRFRGLTFLDEVHISD